MFRTYKTQNINSKTILTCYTFFFNYIQNSEKDLPRIEKIAMNIHLNNIFINIINKKILL